MCLNVSAVKAVKRERERERLRERKIAIKILALSTNLRDVSGENSTRKLVKVRGMITLEETYTERELILKYLNVKYQN